LLPIVLVVVVVIVVVTKEPGAGSQGRYSGYTAIAQSAPKEQESLAQGLPYPGFAEINVFALKGANAHASRFRGWEPPLQG
jgi:hypothetical protein